MLLQDSIVRNIPSPLPTPSHTKKASYARSRNSIPPAAPPAPAQEVATHPNPSPLSHHLRSTQRLFNLLSSRTELDHPLCAECTDILLTNLTRQLEETKKERDGYIAFEKDVRKEKEREGEGMSKEEAEHKILRLKEEERLAVEKLQAAEREREQLAEELRALELEEKVLEEEEAESVHEQRVVDCAFTVALQVLARAQCTSAQIRRTSLTTRRSSGGVRCGFCYP